MLVSLIKDFWKLWVGAFELHAVVAGSTPCFDGCKTQLATVGRVSIDLGVLYWESIYKGSYCFWCIFGAPDFWKLPLQGPQ